MTGLSDFNFVWWRVFLKAYRIFVCIIVLFWKCLEYIIQGRGRHLSIIIMNPKINLSFIIEKVVIPRDPVTFYNLVYSVNCENFQRIQPSFAYNTRRPFSYHVASRAPWSIVARRTFDFQLLTFNFRFLTLDKVPKFFVLRLFWYYVYLRNLRRWSRIS